MQSLERISLSPQALKQVSSVRTQLFWFLKRFLSFYVLKTRALTRFAQDSHAADFAGLFLGSLKGDRSKFESELNAPELADVRPLRRRKDAHEHLDRERKIVRIRLPSLVFYIFFNFFLSKLFAKLLKVSSKSSKPD